MDNDTLLTTFVAGATGFTGRALARQGTDAYGVDLRLQVRPRSRSIHLLEDDPRIVEVDIGDPSSLDKELATCQAVVQLIGTVRARFDAETNYESVDYGTTVKLLEASKSQGIRHFILLSSVGAGFGIGSYLAWKKRTENAVRDSGVPYTILRPSYLAGDQIMRDRRALSNVSAFIGGLADSPLGTPFAAWRPINIQLLARLILHALKQGPGNRTLNGVELFPLARSLGLT